MDKRTINIIIGVVLALFAIFMINNHLRERERLIQELIAKGQIVEVVVATKDIPKEITIEYDMVRLERVKSQAYQPGDLTSVDSAIGKMAEVDILKGQHVNTSMVRALGGIKYLSRAVPQGMRAMTIPVDKISAIEGLVRPGDNVDVVSTFNIPNEYGESDVVVVTIFQGVKVLATNRNLSEIKTSPSIDTITIALYPDDIRTLAYILEWSTIRLVLRSPGDMITDPGYVAVTWEALMKKLGLWQPPPELPIQSTIEVYRATKMEETPVTK
jgi:pilus assembly protein CpaB